MNRLFVGGDVPPRIAKLARDKRGYPVPKFVEWFDGEPNFAIVDPKHLVGCLRFDRCWICGETLGTRKAFVIGPMCMVNRVSAEPPSHYDCARFAALNCPFLTRPLAKRADVSKLPEKFAPGLMIERNPGLCAIWITRTFRLFQPPGGGILFQIGEPERIECYANARQATRQEIDESVQSGLPILEDKAKEEGADAVREFRVYKARFDHLMERMQL